MLDYKIKPLFYRDTTGKKNLIEGSYRDNTIEFLKNVPWECTEKFSGMCVAIRWDGQNVKYDSDKPIPVMLSAKLDDYFKGGINRELWEQKFSDKPTTLWGIGFGNSINEIGFLYCGDNKFLLCDAYRHDRGGWYTRRALEDIGKTFGVGVVPIVTTGPLSQAVEFLRGQPQSTVGTAPMHGLVCRPKVELFNRSGERLIVKLHARDFRNNNIQNNQYME